LVRTLPAAAAVEVEDRLAALIARLHVQRSEPGRPPPRLRGDVAQRDDLHLRRQRVAEGDRAS